MDSQPISRTMPNTGVFAPGRERHAQHVTRTGTFSVWPSVVLEHLTPRQRAHSVTPHSHLRTARCATNPRQSTHMESSSATTRKGKAWPSGHQPCQRCRTAINLSSCSFRLCCFFVCFVSEASWLKKQQNPPLPVLVRQLGCLK